MIVFWGYVIRHMVEVKSFPIMKSRAIFKSYLEVWDKHIFQNNGPPLRRV